MSLIIADRVKETTATQGTGTVTLSGATFGGFQSFSSAIGDGNTTYYCIQNESNFEIGLGTYSSGTLSRDTVIKSSNSGSKISITGAAIVFCVIPADKLLYKDESGNLTITGDLLIDDLTVDYIVANSGDFNGPVSTHKLSSTDIFADNIVCDGDLGVSGLLTLRRESAGNFFHAYIDDSNDRTISLHSDGVSPVWKLGLKNSPSSETAAPNYGYVSAGDSYLALVGSDDNKITLSNASPFCVTHQGINIINAHYMTGVHLNSISSSYPALVVNGGAALSANIQEWNSYGGTVLSVVDNDGSFGIGNNNPSYQLDVTGTGSFSQAVRFGDGSIQTTAAIPYSSGSLIDQNTESIVSNSGYFQSYVDARDIAISGWSQSYTNSVSGNLQSQLNANVSNTSSVSGYFESRADTTDSSLISTSGYFESRVDSADSNTTATSGYFESRVDVADSNTTATSGYFESRVDVADSSVTANSGYFESRVDATDSSVTANSGYFESRADTVDSNLSTVSGLLTPSGESFDFSANTLTYNNSDGGSFTADLSSLSTFDTSGVSLGYSAGTLTYTNNAGGTFGVDLSSISGDVYSMIVGSAPDTLNTLDEIAAALNDDDNIATTLTTLISITSGNLQSQTTSNDADISQLNVNIATVSGLLYDDAAISGYFESRADSAESDIATVSGLLYSDASLSGYFEGRVDSNETNIATNVANINTVSGLLYNDSAISGYFESRSDESDANNSVVSGLLYNYWTVSDGVNSENILANQQVTFSGVDGTDVSYDVSSNTVAISGGGGGGGSSTGIPSGVGFFDDSGSISGNNTFIYDGQDIKVSGAIFSSGERVITSDEIFHIKQLTQAEYDSLTPESATFYIITDAASSSVVQPYREVSSDATALSTDYTINATTSLVLTLPTAIGNEGLLYNIKNTGTGNVVVSGVSSQTIDSQPSFEISTQYQSIKVQSTNSNWIII
jgi:hypothetical protein